jgi:hypothetical protein
VKDTLPASGQGVLFRPMKLRNNFNILIPAARFFSRKISGSTFAAGIDKQRGDCSSHPVVFRRPFLKAAKDRKKNVVILIISEVEIFK